MRSSPTLMTTQLPVTGIKFTHVPPNIASADFNTTTSDQSTAVDCSNQREYFGADVGADVGAALASHETLAHSRQTRFP